MTAAVPAGPVPAGPVPAGPVPAGPRACGARACGARACGARACGARACGARACGARAPGQLVRRADQQPPGPAGVGGPGDPAVAGPGGHPGHDVHPPRVGVLAQHGRGAGRRVRGQQPHDPLVTALHDDQRRAAALPGHRDQVGESGATGVHVHPAPVQADQQQRDVGVGGAGRGIGHSRGRARRVGRVGDVPPLDRVLVHPGHQEAGPVRRPPVPAHPAHLLGRDELGQAVGDAAGTGVFYGAGTRGVSYGAGTHRAGHHEVPGTRTTAPTGISSPNRLTSSIDPTGLSGPAGVTVDSGHVQRAVVNVRDPRAGRVGPGIQGREAGAEQAGKVRAATVAPLAGGSQAGHVYPAGQGECGHGQRAVRREPDDPPGLLTGALASCLLLGGEVLAGRLQGARVGQELLLPRGYVQLPQAGHRVRTALAAQERDPAAVRCHRERARDAEREPPGTGLLPREAFGHGPDPATAAALGRPQAAAS